MRLTQVEASWSLQGFLLAKENVFFMPYEPTTVGLCAQGIFQAFSGIANSLTGLSKTKVSLIT